MSLRRALIALTLGAAAWLPATLASAQEVRALGEGGADDEGLRVEVARALAPLGRDGVVTVTIDASVVRVRYVPKVGAPVERTVPAPADAAERVRAAKFLAVNLVSDEASDLLRELTPPPRPEPPAPTPPVTPPAPAPTPEPGPPVAPPPCTAPRAPAAVSFVSPLGYPWAPSDAPFSFAVLYGDWGASRAFAFSGLAARVRCDARGVVASGLTHWVEGETHGVSAAGLAAVQLGPLHGALAAPVTVSANDVSGAALGVVNVGRTVTGAQIGVVNVATGKVHGAQVGLINVAEDVDAGVGLFSLSWARGIRANAWASTISPIEVGVLFEGKRITTGVSFGRLIQDIFQKGEFLLGFELGVHVIRSDEQGFMWDVVAGTDTSVGVGDGNGLDVIRLGSRLGYRVLPRFAPYLYGGAAGVAKSASAGVQSSSPQGVSPQDLNVRGEFGGGVLF